MKKTIGFFFEVVFLFMIGNIFAARFDFIQLFTEKNLVEIGILGKD